jgi:hypothetical protein
MKVSADCSKVLSGPTSSEGSGPKLLHYQLISMKLLKPEGQKQINDRAKDERSPVLVLPLIHHVLSES